MTHTVVTPALTQYIEDRFATEDDVLSRLRTSLVQGGLPEIQVSPSTGRVLQLLVRLTGGRRVLEVGTLGGYSAIWMARGLLPDGKLTTLEIDADHAAFAREHIAQAGLDDRVDVVVGDARALLPEIGPDGSYDLVFIDADKVNHKNYLERALKLTGSGAVIVADNIVRGGAVIDADSQENSVKGVRAMMAYAATLNGLDMTALQTVGAKGYDGMAIFRVR